MTHYRWQGSKGDLSHGCGEYAEITLPDGKTVAGAMYTTGFNVWYCNVDDGRIAGVELYGAPTVRMILDGAGRRQQFVHGRLRSFDSIPAMGTTVTMTNVGVLLR
jgi:hypothetical protein